MMLEGFLPVAKEEKKEVISDLISFVDKKHIREEMRQLALEGDYICACDGVRLAVAGDIKTFLQKTKSDFDNELLKLATSVLQCIPQLENSITVSFLEFYKACKMLEKYACERNKSKKITKKIPVSIQVTDNKLTMQVQNKEQRIILNCNSTDSPIIYVNISYFVDALQLFKNRKYDRRHVTITINYLDAVNPLTMQSDNLLIFILPVKVQ